jgi:type IV secretion system protein TrbJ
VCSSDLEWLKTLRKKNASVIFATQSLSDIDGSAIAPAIIESCPTRLFLPNERAIEPQITAIYRRFGLNDRQIEILARATPKRDYYCQSRRGNRLFELGLGKVALAFTAASSKSDQAAIEKVLAEHGRDSFVAGWLAHRGVGWAADHPKSLGRRIIVMRIRHLVAASAIALSIVSVDTPSSAQVVVFDPNNYAQNVLRAARALQQINNQITSLQNQAQMLINQARNLASLTYSSLRQLQSSIQRTQQMLSQAQRIAYDVQKINTAFSTTYAPVSASTSNQALIANAQARWQTSIAALQDALKVQAGVVGNLDTNRTQTSALVTSSQSATGALQATQAGNQLMALQAQQLADLTATVAAQGRAQSLEAAQRTAAQDQGREQLRRFLIPGVGYQPTNVQMFH